MEHVLFLFSPPNILRLLTKTPILHIQCGEKRKMGCMCLAVGSTGAMLSKNVSKSAIVWFCD